MIAIFKSIAAGLSPRVRGNPKPESPLKKSMRSIPASAGEPSLRLSLRLYRRVYPRECGGTAIVIGRCFSEWGLSPRVRGNRLLSVSALVWRRSIPASAGEPLLSNFLSRQLTVYPRECGGTEALNQMLAGTGGLSPRVRGNLVSVPDHAPYNRSIPASAGEPHRGAPIHFENEVYPRECGGTSISG